MNVFGLNTSSGDISMSKDEIDYVKTFRKEFLTDHIKIKTPKGIKTLKDVAVYWDPEKCYILDNEDTMTVILSNRIEEIKQTKETSEKSYAMIIQQVAGYFPKIFDKREQSNIEVG